MSNLTILFFYLLVPALVCAVAVLGSLVYILRAKLKIEKERARLWESLFIDGQKNDERVPAMLVDFLKEFDLMIQKHINANEPPQRSNPAGL